MASIIGELVAHYQNRVLNTVQKLKEEAANPQSCIEGAMGELKGLVSMKPNEAAGMGMGMVDQVKRATTDTSPISLNEESCKMFMDNFIWVAVCLFVQGFVFMFSRIILAGIYGLIFDTSIAFIIAVLAMPAFGYMKVQKRSGDMSFDVVEMFLLGMGMLLSTFTGFLVSGRILNCASPPLFLIPLCIGVVIGVSGAGLGGNRTVLLGSTVGSAVGLLFLYGMIMGFSFGYLIWILGLAAAAAVELQLQLSSIPSSPRSRVAAQWRFIAVVTVTNLIMYLLMSGAAVTA